MEGSLLCFASFDEAKEWLSRYTIDYHIMNFRYAYVDCASDVIRYNQLKEQKKQIGNVEACVCVDGRECLIGYDYI